MSETVFSLDKECDGRMITAGMVFKTERFGNVAVIGFDTYGVVRPRTYVVTVNRTMRKLTPPVKELGKQIDDPSLLWLAMNWLETTRDYPEALERIRSVISRNPDLKVALEDEAERSRRDREARDHEHTERREQERKEKREREAAAAAADLDAALEPQSGTDHEEPVKKRKKHHGSSGSGGHREHGRHHHHHHRSSGGGGGSSDEYYDDEYGGSYNGDEDAIGITKLSEAIEPRVFAPATVTPLVDAAPAAPGESPFVYPAAPAATAPGSAPAAAAAAAATEALPPLPMTHPVPIQSIIPPIHAMSRKEIAELFVNNGTCTIEEAAELEAQLATEKLDGRALVRLWLYTTKHEFLFNVLQRIGVKSGIATTIVHLVTSSVRHFSKSS